jgi:hypothetical protein
MIGFTPPPLGKSYARSIARPANQGNTFTALLGA